MNDSYIEKLEKIGGAFRDVVAKELPKCGVMIMWGIIDGDSIATGIATENLTRGDMECIMFTINGRAYNMSQEK
jgi:hypothetical protein